MEKIIKIAKNTIPAGIKVYSVAAVKKLSKQRQKEYIAHLKELILLI